MTDIDLDAIAGSVFARELEKLSGTKREDAILDHIQQRHVPSHLLELMPVEVSSRKQKGIIYAMPDYLGVGTDLDWIRTPMLPTTAQAALDVFDMVMPTKRIVDLLWQKGTRIPFQAQVPPRGTSITASALYIASNDACVRDCEHKSGILVGHKKEIVITRGLKDNARRLAIYGAWYDDKWPLQGFPTRHNSAYVDYSHGVRGIARTMQVNDEPMCVEDVLRDPLLCGLISDEGIVTVTRYAP